MGHDPAVDPAVEERPSVAEAMPRLAAWVLRDGAKDSVPGMLLKLPDGRTVMRPMMGDVDAMVALRTHAQNVANDMKRPIRLVQSTGFEEIETLQPQHILLASPGMLPGLPGATHGR